MARELEVDEALATIGGFRPWHVLIFLMTCTSAFGPITWVELCIVFIGYAPPHHCKIPDGMPIDNIIPSEEKHGKVVYDSCYKYVNKTIDNSTMKCDQGWVYDVEKVNEKSISSEWDLVCDDNYLPELSQTIYQVGCFIGQLVGSQLSDTFGRKKIHVLGCIGVGIVGILTAFSTQYVGFAIMRCAMGFMVTLNVYAGFVLMLELFDSKRRVYIGIGFNIWWVALYQVLPFLAYFIRNWKYLHAILGAYSFIWIIYLWVLPESPFWLAANNRYEQAKKDIIGMAKMNGVEMEPFTLKRLEKHQKEQAVAEADTELLQMTFDGRKAGISNGELVPPEDGKDGMHAKDETARQKEEMMHTTELKAWHILLDSKMRVHLGVALVFWLANNMVFYGLVLSTPVLAGNRFINYMIGGFVEIPGYLIAIFCAKKFGRRLTCVVGHILTAIPLGVTLFIPEYTASGVNLGPLRVATAMLAKLGISATFAVVILYTTELFPTNLRTSSLGLCNILGRIGGMLAPIAAYAAKRLYWLPNVIFSIIVMIAGFLILLLPETGDRPLPNTLYDIHQLYKPKDETLTQDERNEETNNNLLGSPQDSAIA